MPSPLYGALDQRVAVEQIVIARRLEAGEPHRERNLRPMPQFMQQDVKEQLPRRHRPLLLADFERTRRVDLVVTEVGHVLFQLTSDRGAVVEQRPGVVAGQSCTLRKRLRGEPLQMTAFHQKNMIDQFTDGGQTTARLDWHIERRGVVAQPVSPLLALRVCIPHHFVEADRQRHGYFITSPTSTILSGPRLSELMPDSIALRSPTTTTASFSGWI